MCWKTLELNQLWTHGDSREAWMNRRPETHPVTEQTPQVGSGKSSAHFTNRRAEAPEVNDSQRSHS